MSRADKARELFLSGYNCSQAVLGAFCDDMGLDFDVAISLSAGFGGGIGRLRETCGAVSGAVMVVSLSKGKFDVTNPDEKNEIYKKIQQLVKDIEAQTGSIICADLLRVPRRGSSHVAEIRNDEYYKKRPCADLVFIAASAAEKILSEQE